VDVTYALFQQSPQLYSEQLSWNGDGRGGNDTVAWGFYDVPLTDLMGGQAGTLTFTSTITEGAVSEAHTITINVAAAP
jgi:hypothetical protein